MQLTDFSGKHIKEVCETLAPNLIRHPAFMFYCKSEKDREEFIKVYFGYFLRKWSNEIILINESGTVLVTLIDINNFHAKDKGKGLSKLKRYKNAYANVSYHQGNIFYLTEIVAPAKINTKIMTVYSTLKNKEEANSLVDEAIELAKENDYMIVYETFSKKSGSIMAEKGFEIAYEKLFQGTQFFETIMTYYSHDSSKPVKLVEEFHPISIHDDSDEETENEEEEF